MIEFDLKRCECGGHPEIYTSFTVATGRYQGLVECLNCGKQVFGKQHLYDKDDAAEDAVEEWNLASKVLTKEDLEEKLDRKLKAGEITKEEAEDEWQEFMHRNETWSML